MTPITDLLLPALAVAGVYLAAAVGLRRSGQLAHAWLADQWMTKDLMSRQWRPRHAYTGRPALVAALAMSAHTAAFYFPPPVPTETAVEPVAEPADPSSTPPAPAVDEYAGATEDWSPAADVATVGPGRLREPARVLTLEDWLADDRAEEDFAEAERDWAAEFYAETEQACGPAAAAACAERIGVILDGIIRHAAEHHGEQIVITERSMSQWREERDRAAALELGKKILAAEEPTGEYPIVREVVAVS